MLRLKGYAEIKERIMPHTINDPFQKMMETFSLPKNAPLAVAVSGGADSMCLLRLLHSWAQTHYHPFIALTVDHGLRAEAKDEALQVKEWCDMLGISHHILTWEGEKPTRNIQSQARKIRYQLMQDFCKQHQIRYLFLGHHAQDQAETVMLRLFRGAGVSGLKAMQPITQMADCTLLRPLLHHRREEIETLLDQMNQSYIHDPSNEDARFERVMIRRFLNEHERKQELLNHMQRTAHHMQRADDFIQSHLNEALSQIVKLHPFGYATMRLASFQSLHEEIALRLLSHVIFIINGKSKTPRMEELERLHLALSHAHESFHSTLAGCYFRQGKSKHDHEYIYIMRETSLLPDDMALTAENCFDGRFMCNIKTLPENLEAFSIGALKEEGWQHIKQQVFAPKLPLEVFYALPTLKHLEKIIAVPHISYVADKMGNGFTCHFLRN